MYRIWYGEPQRIRGFLVEHHFEFDGLQDWKIGWLRPPQDPPRINSSLLVRRRNVRAIADEASHHGILAELIHGRKPVLRGERYNPVLSCVEERSCGYQHRAHLLVHKAREGCLQVLIVHGSCNEQILFDAAGCVLDVFQLPRCRWEARVDQGAQLTDNTGFFGSTGADLGSQSANGGLGGVQVGCNYQTGNWVFGIQGDYDWASATSNNNNNNTFIVLSPALGISALSASTKIDSLASVTGRVGYSWSRFLGYVKGGGAWVKDEYSLQGTLIAPFNGTQTVGSLTNTRGGWTVGVGGEYAFLDWLTGFAEYDYYGFTSQSANFNCVSGTVVCTIPGTTTAVGTIPINATQHINVFKVGLNLKFGGGLFGGW